MLSTELPEQKYGGTYPDALAQTADGKQLFVADASANAVAVFDMSIGSPTPSVSTPEQAEGFIPTEWYPTALAAAEGDLMIVTGKGEGTGPNSGPLEGTAERKEKHPYIARILHGSVARVGLGEIQESSC